MLFRSTLSTYSFTPYFDDEEEIPAAPADAMGLAKQPDEGLTPVLKCISIIMENMGSRMTKDVPSIVEFTQSPPDAESLQISNTIRVNFAMPDVSSQLAPKFRRHFVLKNVPKVEISIFPRFVSEKGSKRSKLKFSAILTKYF